MWSQCGAGDSAGKVGCAGGICERQTGPAVSCESGGAAHYNLTLKRNICKNGDVHCVRRRLARTCCERESRGDRRRHQHTHAHVHEPTRLT